MPFKTGHEKVGGRRAGSINKKTAEQKKRIEYVLSILQKTLAQDIKTIDATERTKLWCTLQEYMVPKLARTEVSGELGINATISETTQFNLKKKG